MLTTFYPLGMISIRQTKLQKRTCASSSATFLLEGLEPG